MDDSDYFAHSLSGSVAERLASLVSVDRRGESGHTLEVQKTEVARELSRLIYAFTKIGPILTPEVIKVPSISDEVDRRDEFELYQRRFCLTVVKNLGEMASHMRVFGPLTFRLNSSKLFQLGPIPVIYYPQQNEGKDTGFDTALTVVHELNLALNLLRDIELLAYSGTERHLGKIERAIPSFEPISEYREWLVKFLSNLGITSVKLKQIERALHVAGSCMYPSGQRHAAHTESDSGAFEFFREREWRIIAGATANRVESTEILNEQDIALISQLDSGFFRQRFDFLEENAVSNSGCLDLCRKFSETFTRQFFAAVEDVYIDKYCLDIQDEGLQAAIGSLRDRFKVISIEAF